MYQSVVLNSTSFVIELKKFEMNRGRISAGLLMYRLCDGVLQVYLAHPGGPFFQHKDHGHWTIPKGEVAPGEALLATALREFREETGIEPCGGYLPLGSIRQRGGKTVHGWAFAGDRPVGHVHKCNLYQMEWPPGSGNWGSYPEVDRVGFFTLAEARHRMKEAQLPFLDRLVAVINVEGNGRTSIMQPGDQKLEIKAAPPVRATLESDRSGHFLKL